MTTATLDEAKPGAPARAPFEGIPSSRNQGGWVRLSPGVWYLTIEFVNVYAVGDGERVPVDTGLPGTAALTRVALARRWDAHRSPVAIVLTHGHFDHEGSALELPYLTGRSHYPPQDPTMGGAIAQMSRLFPHAGRDLGGRVHASRRQRRRPGDAGGALAAHAGAHRGPRSRTCRRCCGCAPSAASCAKGARG